MLAQFKAVQLSPHRRLPRLVADRIAALSFVPTSPPRAGLVIIVLLAAAIAATILAAWRTQRVAAWLLAPYLVWVVYAATLNAGIVTLNV